MFDSTITTVVMGVALAAAILLSVLAIVGFLAIVRLVWQEFARRVAQPYVSDERRRARKAARYSAALAAAREEAAVTAASTIATAIVRTVSETHLRHLAAREDEHLRRSLGWNAAPMELPDSTGEKLPISLTHEDNAGSPTRHRWLGSAWLIRRLITGTRASQATSFDR